MSFESGMKQLLLALCVVGITATLTACGGSSSNVSPGNIVVPPDGPAEPNEPNEPNEPTEPPNGDTIASVIPSSLSDAIYDSGETANGKPVYIIDVAALPGGVLDPSGLLLGNDFIFRIEGGALRVAQN